MQIDSQADVPIVTTGPMTRLSGAARAVKLFAVRQPLGAVSVVIILVLLVIAVFAPLLEPADPYKVNVYEFSQEDKYGRFAEIGEGGYTLGADKFGRDILSRLIRGSRISLYVSMVSTFIGVSIGAALGIISATRSGPTDMVIQRIVDALMAFPNLILALAIRATMGASLENVIIAITITIIPPTARAIRSQTLSVVNMDYVTGARAVGAGYWRIVLRHVLPNTLALIVILLSITLGAAIIVESSLSFLGLGGPPDEPSWGGLIGGSETYYFLQQQPILIIGPAIAIGLVVFAFNMLGDALRDIWDPRMRGSR